MSETNRRYLYSTLENTSRPDVCLQECLCRNMNGRSVKDRYNYARFVLNQPVQSLTSIDNNLCKNNNVNQNK
jgi:hypothetical protein